MRSAPTVDESAPAAIKWSFRDLPRVAALFVERHGEADPTQLKPPQIRALALAMLSSDKKPAIDTIKRQLKVLKNAGVAAPSSPGQQPRTAAGEGNRGRCRWAHARVRQLPLPVPITVSSVVSYRYNLWAIQPLQVAIHEVKDSSGARPRRRALTPLITCRLQR